MPKSNDPYYSTTEPDAMDPCVCGHLKYEHVYGEMGCRPKAGLGPPCGAQCLRYTPVPSTPEVDSLESFKQTVSDVLNYVDAYRTECVAHGYSPDISEQMALQMHGYLIESMKQAIIKATS